MKKYTFSREELTKLQNVEIGLANAEATLNGLQVYKQLFLEQVYKRCGLNTKVTKKITYNLSKNEIIVDDVAKK